jgi:hypothetical protein
MTLKCFCESDKYAYPTLFDRLCCCVCSGKKEELIKLACCNNYVHRSCFINSAIIHSNSVINSKDTPDQTLMSEIDICHYCRKPYSKSQFPNIPNSNEEITIRTKNDIVNVIVILLWCIAMLLALGCGLSDNVLFGGFYNKGISFYKNISINDCLRNNEGKSYEDCNGEFKENNRMITMGVVMISSIISVLIIILVCFCWNTYTFMKYHKYFEERPMPDKGNRYYITTGGLKIFINSLRYVYKSNMKRLIIPFVILVWQLIYLVMILGYNLWYIPAHTSSNTTIDEARHLALIYISVLCCFNVFWAILTIIAIVIIIIGMCYVFWAIEWIIKNCYECCRKNRENIRNNLTRGETNIKSYTNNEDNTLKKISNII